MTTNSEINTQWNEARLRFVEGVPIQLPSGPIVRVRSVDFGLFLALGDLPDSLTPLVSTMLNKNSIEIQQIVKDAESEQVSKESLMQSIQIYRAYAVQCVVTPRVVCDRMPEEGEIHADMLSTADLLAIWRLITVPAVDLELFRYEPEADVDGVGVAENDPPPGESDSGVEPVD